MTKRAQAVSDEEIIAALLSTGTIKAAADAAGLSTRALYDRMNAPEFRTLYRQAKTDVIRSAVHNLNSHIQEAVDTIADILTDTDTNPAVRLQAAGAILSNAEKFSKRVQAEENGIQSDKESNLFDFDWIRRSH